jgi:hypothetical protein
MNSQSSDKTIEYYDSSQQKFNTLKMSFHLKGCILLISNKNFMLSFDLLKISHNLLIIEFNEKVIIIKKY